jgi:hypothetical protein
MIAATGYPRVKRIQAIPVPKWEASVVVIQGINQNTDLSDLVDSRVSLFLADELA